VNIKTATAVKPPLVAIFSTREPPSINCDEARANTAEPYNTAPPAATNVGRVPGAGVTAAARVASDANSCGQLARKTTARASGCGDSAGCDDPARHGVAKASLKRVETSPDVSTRL